MLERFFGLATGLAPYEWDDFENKSFADPRLEGWRQRILQDIGAIVAPMTPENEVVANDRAALIIEALKKDQDAQD